MHEIVFTQRAVADWEQLDKQTQSRVTKKLKEFSSTPFRYACKLTDPKIGTYRFRVGNIRIIFDVEKEKIVVLRIGDRKEIYR